MVTDRPEETAPPRERLNLDGRDPDTLTEREKLAYAYPEVYALLLELQAAQVERDQARGRVADLEQLERRALDAQRGNASETDEYERGWLDAAHHILKGGRG